MREIKQHLYSDLHKTSVKGYNTLEQRSINYNDVELEGKKIIS
uniref:Uncharacterized protein n=1 Tax=Meloidogyne enterolobii TaxID=390850 RepID=A0A6V7X114_MELEN|nr:unnamed protein product [Meloidogyne enterolobii]